MSTSEQDYPTVTELTEDMFFMVSLSGDPSDKHLYSASSLVQLLGNADELKNAAGAVKQELARAVSLINADLRTTLAKQSRLDIKDYGLDKLVGLSVDRVGPEANGLAMAQDVYGYANANFLTRDQLLPFSSVVLGQNAGQYCGNIGSSVLLGTGAGLGSLYAFKDFVTLGARAQSLGDRTVVLGSPDTQVHAALPVATRGDARDFTDTQPLDLGLEFVLKLNPKRAVMDLREDYIDYSTLPFPPQPPKPAPVKPTIDISDPKFKEVWAAYQTDLDPWLKENRTYLTELAKWKQDYTAWQSVNRLGSITPDGTHKRSMNHAILLCDDLLKAAGLVESSYPGVIDGVQDGGMDLKTHRVEEMVPVLVKAFQDLYAHMHSDAFVEKVAQRLFEKEQAARQARKQPPVAGD